MKYSDYHSIDLWVTFWALSKISKHNFFKSSKNFKFDFFSETRQSYEESYTMVEKACVNIDDVFDFCPKKKYPLSKDNQGYQGYAVELSKNCQMDELRQSAVSKEYEV